MGKPTVATKTEAMSVFADYTYLAETKEGYIDCIDNALLEDNDQLHLSREQFAKQHTWENNILEISRAVVMVKESDKSVQKN